MPALIVQVGVSRGGLPKHAVPRAEVTVEGIAGDSCAQAFHGGRRQALLLIAAEAIEELVSEGFPVFPGALGENLTTRGLDRRSMRVGQRYRAGAVIFELTKLRWPCGALGVYGEGIEAALFDAQTAAGDPTSPRWGLSGFYASVIQPGCILTGDAIALAQDLA